ncbi:MAG TPA: HPF/RaiA family ribosome-associated protein [Candidatus Paceibacterota bacterium]|nr:HPF/RaiA family ribosome-associated protein [Candidatus Paceibacterota bacterium]
MNPTIQYTLTAQHLIITSDIETQVKKVVSVLQKYIEQGDESARAHFVLRFEKQHMSDGMYIVEIDFHARHIDAAAKGEKDILIAALDDARDELAEVLRTHKEKKIHFIRRGARSVKNFLRGFPNRRNQ